MREMKNKDLIVKFRSDCQFELTEPFNFYLDVTKVKSKEAYYEIQNFLKQDDYGLHIEIPKGFDTDFGSVPELFQSIVSPIGLPTKAYVTHDYLCVLSHKGLLKRKTADDVFYGAMIQLGVSKFKAIALWSFVRLYALCKGLK